MSRKPHEKVELPECDRDCRLNEIIVGGENDKTIYSACTAALTAKECRNSGMYQERETK